MPQNNPPSKPSPLPTTESSDVPPAFGIVVYVSENASGKTVARVANLEGITIEGSSERDVLGKVVAKCKVVLQESTAGGNQPPWLEPPHVIADGERRRFLPMHL